MNNTDDKYEYGNLMNVLKFIGIVFVVMGHSGNQTIEKFVGLFHMAVFFFVSGFFYNIEYSINPKKMIIKRFKSLYIPYLKYSILFLVLHNLLFTLKIYSSNISYVGKFIEVYDLNSFIKALIQILLFANREPMLGAFWFFTTLFFTSILFSVITYCSKRINVKESESIIFILVIISFVIGNLATKLGITIPRVNNSLVMILFYYVGYLYKKCRKQINLENMYFFIAGIMMLLLNNLYGGIAVNSNSYLSPAFLIVNSLLGIYCSLFLGVKILSNKVISNLAEYIGKNSLVIMALHFISFKLIDFIRILIYSLPIEELSNYPVIDGGGIWWIAYTLTGIIIPIVIQVILEKTFTNIKKLGDINKVKEV